MALHTYNLERYIDNDTFETIKNESTSLKTLPVTHKVSFSDAKRIIKSGEIIPEQCDVFLGSDLVYLFYGRPAFSRKDSTYNMQTHFPVCFILDLMKIKFEYVFPFDSGAFANERYLHCIPKDILLKKFSLEPNIDFIKKFIKHFYDTNKNYYCANCKKIDLLGYNPNEYELYYKLIGEFGEMTCDERKSSIEIICEQKIVLKDSLIAIVMPTAFSNTVASEFGPGVEVLTYNTFGGSPDSYHGVIREKMYNYLSQKKYF